MDAFEFEFEYKPWLVVLPVAEAIFCCILNIVPKWKKEKRKANDPWYFFSDVKILFSRYLQIVQSWHAVRSKLDIKVVDM